MGRAPQGARLSCVMGDVMTLRTGRRGFLLGAASLPFLARGALASELFVVSSGAMFEAFRTLGPIFTRISGIGIRAEGGSSMGASPTAIPNRLARGEPIDVMLMAQEAFDDMVAKGFGMPGTRVDVCRSLIGMAVREGAPKPDISTVDKLREVLLAATSVGYSASASGVYIETEMYRRLGIHDQMMAKSRKILTERVAAVVARGEVEIGFQQVSEILGIPGASFVGTIPDAVQRPTIFSGGLSAKTANAEAGRRLLAFLASRDAAEELRRTGLEPLAG